MYDNVALEFEGENILIAKIDADDAEAMAKKYDVEQYPTMWLFTGGSDEGIEYLGDLDEESVKDFVREELDSMESDGSGHADAESDKESDFLDDDDDGDDDGDVDDDESDAEWDKMQDDIDHMNDILSGSAKKNETVSAPGTQNTTTTKDQVAPKL